MGTECAIMDNATVTLGLVAKHAKVTLANSVKTTAITMGDATWENAGAGRATKGTIVEF